MKTKRKYKSRNMTEATNITMEDRLRILANVIVDRIMEDQQGKLTNQGGDNG
ncbi:MAG: hypothetical protein WCV93_04670 [Candidatus Shapirobacteria bacterium]|jgi:hypothetical protein